MVLPLLFKSEITEADLQGLQGLPSETDLLDIKSRSYTVKPDDVWKPEICEDISAFANANGGLVVLGMQESVNGKVGDLCGLGVGLNVDDEIKRLKQVADTGIDPPVIGLRFLPVDLTDPAKHAAIAIQVPKDLRVHKVLRLRQGVSQSAQIFKIRHSNGNADMSLDELGIGFRLADSYAERIRAFRSERAKVIQLGDEEYLPVRLDHGTYFVLHAIPFSATERGSQLDLTAFREPFADWLLRGKLSTYASYGRFNLDGFVRPYGAPKESYPGYTQVFRNGAIEFVGPVYAEQPGGRKQASLRTIQQQVLGGLRDSLLIQQNLTVPLPIVILLSFVGTQDLEFVFSHDDRIKGRVDDVQHAPLRQSMVLIPEAILEDYNTPGTQVMKPIFDILWNVAGIDRSLSYATDGRWIEK